MALTEDIKAFDNALTAKMSADAADRLDRWIWKMESDEKALGQFITAPGISECPVDPDGAVHPQQRVRDEAAKYSRLWNPSSLPDAQSIDEFMDWVPDGGFACTGWEVTGRQLQANMTSNTASSAGCDGWKPSELALLPWQWFDRLALFWNQLVKQKGKLPSQFLDIRTVLIPKPDDDSGAKRPIGIAVAVWRCCCTAMVRNVTPWAMEWMHPSIYCATGVTADDLHDRFAAALQHAVDSGAPLCGGKIDLSKCFDRVFHLLATRTLRLLGLPEEVCSLINQFYEHSRTWFSCQGDVSDDPVLRTCSLLQGCPWSVLAVNAIMTAFCHYVEGQEPDVQWGCFIDDRLTWVSNSTPAESLHRAIKDAQYFDNKCHFVWNSDKGATFSVRNKDEAKLTDTAELIGSLQPRVKNLGIVWGVKPKEVKDGHHVTRHRAVTAAALQLRRIRKACGQNFWKTKRAIRKYINPKFAWGGQWQCPSDTATKRQARLIENCVAGYLVPGRSPARLD